MVDEVSLQRQRDLVERAGDLLRDAEDDGRRHHQDVEVRREREVTSGLFQSAQVSVDEDQHDPHGDEQRIGRVAQAGDGARQDRGTGRALDRHGHRVVNEQCDGGDLSDLRSEVVARHDVRSAGRRVVLDDVHVGGRDEEQDAEDDEHNRHDEGERREANEGRHLREDLFGAVRGRGDTVRSEDAERDGPVESFPAQLFGDEGFSEKDSLDSIPEGLGIDVGDVGVRGQNP